MLTATFRACLAALSIGALALAGPAHATEVPAMTQAATDAGIHQLRVYEIFEHNKDAFHARFRDHAARIMRRHGFEIVGMWEAAGEGRTEFVYLLRWPDEAAMDRHWARFMADPEWADIKEKTAARHGKLVGAIESKVLRPAGNPPPA